MLVNDMSKLREHQFRELLLNLPAAVQGYRSDGTVQYWNFASERLYGYSAEEAIGKNLLDLIIPDELRAYVIRDMQRIIDTGQVAPPEELSLKCKDGSLVVVSF